MWAHSLPSATTLLWAGHDGPPKASALHGRPGKVDRCRGSIVQRLMGTLPIVERHIACDALACLAWAGVVVEVDLLVLQAAPEALGKDVIQGSPFAIHTDLHASGLHALGVLRAGEVTALIAIPDPWCRHAERRLDGLQHERHLERLVKRPAHHVAGVPVKDGDQVHPTLPQADIGDVNAPNVVGEAGLHPA